MTDKIEKYLYKLNSELDSGLICGYYIKEFKKNNKMLYFKILFPSGEFFSKIGFAIEVDENVWDCLYSHSIALFSIKSLNEYQDFLRSVKIQNIKVNSLSKFS